MLQLAFSVYKNPGVYALLLGSGVSRSAEILTGWDIVNDLIRQFATVNGVELNEEPAIWYQKQYGDEPKYDDLLEKLGRTSLERNKVLRQYFEPTDEERERGAKLPTQAHRAIASLVKSGHIRVILTTNFDRLLETALQDVGIAPIVISATDMLKGAPPLQHTSITIIKLHGDYLDGRIKNTTDELLTYEPEMNQFLDRVFDEYGLIICGWSAKWDIALRDALYRANRRYSAYWTDPSDLAPEAANLCKHRDAQFIKIKADDFFVELQQTIDAFERANREDPLSVVVAVERTKKLIPRQDSWIELEELLTTQIEHAYQALNSIDFINRRNTLVNSPHDFSDMWNLYFGAIESALNVLATLCFYGKGMSADKLEYAIKRWIATSDTSSWKSFPIVLLIYACGISVVQRNSWEYLPALLTLPKVKSPYGHETRSIVIQTNIMISRLIEHKNWHQTIDTNLHRLIRPIFRSYIPSDDDFNKAYDLFGLILALVEFAEEQGGIWQPHSSLQENRAWEFMQNFWLEGGKKKNEWGLLKVGVFQNNSNLEQLLDKYIKRTRDANFYIPDYFAEYKKGLES